MPVKKTAKPLRVQQFGRGHTDTKRDPLVSTHTHSERQSPGELAVSRKVLEEAWPGVVLYPGDVKPAE